jgi:hypothetical protein
MTDLEDLIQKRTELSAHMVVLMVQILIILLTPLAVVIYATNLLNSIFNTGKLVAIPLTVSALALSWISIWKIYTKVDKDMSELDKQIRDIKISQGYDPNINTKRQEYFDKED